MSKTMMASQLIYTSWPNGSSQKKGFMVYSKSEDITQEEENEIVASFRYVAPNGLPFAPDGEQVRTLFPIMYGFAKLSSGRYAIAQSAYIGQDYTKRYGNYMIHAFVFDSPCSSFVLPLWGSPLFKRALTNEELNAPKAPGPLPKIKLSDAFDVSKVLPYRGDKSFLAALLDIGASALSGNKKMNVFVDMKDMSATLQALYFCMGDSLREKAFFTTFASGDPKLFNLLARPKEQLASYASGMNPLLVNVSLANCKDQLPKGVSPYASFVAELFSEDPAKMAVNLAELDAYVSKGLVLSLDEACVLRRLKNLEFDAAPTWQSLVKYLPSLGKICPIATLEKAYSYALAHYPSQRLDVYEYFFPLFSEQRKKEIFQSYYKENRIPRFASFLNGSVSGSAIAPYAVSFLLSEAKSHPSILEKEEYKAIVSFLFGRIAREERQKLLSLAFKSLYAKQDPYFLQNHLPLIRKEMEADRAYALSLYRENEADAKSYPQETKTRFNELFYPYVGDKEKKAMWGDYINQVLRANKDVSLERLLDSKFGDKKDGIALMEQCMDQLIPAFKKDHPSLILDLELGLLAKKDARYLSDVREYYLDSIKGNQHVSFLKKVGSIDVTLKRKLYEAPLKDRAICKEKLNIAPQAQFGYISLLLTDADLSLAMPYWEAFFLLEDLFPSNASSLENQLIDKLVVDPQYSQKLSKDADAYPRAKDIFSKIQVKQFKEAQIGSVAELARRYKSDILCSRLLDEETKGKTVSVLLDKLSQLLSSGKPSLEAASSAYVELKDFTMGSEGSKKRFLSILKPCFDNAAISDLDRLFGRSGCLESLVGELDRASIPIPSLTLVREGELFKRRNKGEIASLGAARKFLYLNKSALDPYLKDFCALYLEDILRFYFDGTAADRSPDRLALYVFPFMEYKRFDKTLVSVLEERSDAIPLILDWIDYESSSHDARMKTLLEAVDLYFKKMDKKQREEAFEQMKQTKRPSVVKYVESYEKSHKGFFAKLFGR